MKNQKIENKINKNNIDMVNNIISKFNLSDKTQDSLIYEIVNKKNFNNFCNNYSKLHGKTKQVKKEFLLMVAYSSEFSFLSDKKENYKQQKEEAELIEKTKGALDYLEKINDIAPESSLVSKIAGVPFFDGSSIMKSIVFNTAEYSNIKNVKDIVDTIKSKGHVELNSIIKSADSNTRLFYAYISEMHKEEVSFVHNYFPKGNSLSINDIKDKKENILHDLKVFDFLYKRLSQNNKELAFFCETNDLINIISKATYVLKLNKNKLLDEKDHQFTPDVFKFYHHRFGLEIMRRCFESEVEKLNNSNSKTFLDKITNNYSDHTQMLHEFYFLQTKKNINKDFKKIFNCFIDFSSIKNSFIHADNHLNILKEYLSTDINLQQKNLNIVNKIENNIKIITHNLILFNEKNNSYRDMTTLVNRMTSGKLEFSLPYKLQTYELKDLNGNKILEKINGIEQPKLLYKLYNETSILYQSLLIDTNPLINKEQINLALLSKSNFEIYKASGSYEDLSIKNINNLRVKENDLNSFQKPIAKSVSLLLSRMINENKNMTENDFLGILSNSVNKALLIKNLGGNLTYSTLKVLDKASILLDTVKEISLNKSIYNNINELIENINFDNQNIKISKEIINSQSLVEKSNKRILIEPKKVEQIKNAVEKFIKTNYSDDKLDDAVNQYIEKRKKL